MNPKYPIYIISKGRWKSRLTAKALDEIRVPYHIVIEPQEYDQYAAVIDPKKILVTPFSNLGQGSIPSRNFVWEHSISIGAKRHWILDDNISAFVRLNRNLKIKVSSGTIFKCAEDFTDRYSNVAISGFNYDFFCKRKQKIPPFYLNTRVYSMILIDNQLKFRWRGKYNEDTDLCLRALKKEYCTILFNAFLGRKQQTMTMSGGNTEELYLIEDGRQKMTDSLINQHSDVVVESYKFGHVHHHVNYSPFKFNKLNKINNFHEPSVNNYGMKLINIDL